MYKSMIYLSNSSIDMFLKCKRKYKYKYIDRITTNFKIANKYLSFGQSMHTTLAQFNKIKETQLKTLNNLFILLKRNWIREGYENTDEEREFGLRGLSMLENYYNAPLDQGERDLIIEEMIKKDMGGKFVLCGKLDKVYIRNNNLLETIDYKTGNSIQHISGYQLPIYVLLTQEKLGCYPDIISYYYLAYNKKIEQEVTAKLVDAVIESIWNIYEVILAEKEFACSFSPHCQIGCEYFLMCEEAKGKSVVLMKTNDRQKYPIISV